MQFSPNIRTRYAAALRIYIHKKVNKNGIDKKTTSLYRNILLFEILKCDKAFETDLYYFFDRLSCAVSVEKLKSVKWIDIRVSGADFGKINRNAMIYIISRCFDAKYIRINLRSGYIKITADKITADENLKRIIRNLKGVIIKDIAKNKYGIFIPFSRCKNPILKSPDEYDYLFNPLSPLKVFLGR